MKLIDNIPVCGAPDEGALKQIKTCARTADKVALMADHHKGYAVPIGGVIAVILEGIENESEKLSLYSTVHGAGRLELECALQREEASHPLQKRQE